MATTAEIEAACRRAQRRSGRRRRRAHRRETIHAAGRTAAVAAVVVSAWFGVSAARGNPAGAAPPPRHVAGVERRCPIPSRFRPAFAAASRATGVPLSLLTAVAEQESRFDPVARSRAGAQGLMQVMPATARQLGLDPAVPSSNVLAGARYLRRMLDRFADNELALAAYNAGPSAVARAGPAPAAETVAYVRDVSAASARLTGCI